ncbi:GNAT family N-acetyltransferase [Micromonospora echinofusca]|uniref:GNAT family N-acetyltransferase n=1 Tax=Micromonospora echinofusca TaxID=47858 RepID=A0ABS3VYY8_MICEH|nr:GNAT family N-acetyltransferase [Micromonospora echinofusca]MBO4209723.1 GNAT family N-acetyltransferase [Micromonospora echinofusca]
MVVIRPEEPEDAEAVASVHVRGWRAGYAGIMPDEVLTRLNPAAWAQRRRDAGTADPDHPFRTLVAMVDGQVAGFTTFGPYRRDQDPDDLDPAHGELLSMFVDPGRWGQGVGRELMRATRAGLAGQGRAELRLWVLADNRRARAFYQRDGLTADGERMTYQVPLAGGRTPVGLVELRYAARLDAA